MITGLFNSLAGVFKGFFSRAFWFSAFMPVALAVALHLAVAWLVFPKELPLARWVNSAAKDNLAIFPLVSAAVIVLAYAIGPLAPVAMGFLDASRLPRFIRIRLRRRRLSKAFVAHERLLAASAAAAAYASLRDRRIDAMIEARLAGADKTGEADASLSRRAIESATAAAGRMARGELPDYPSLSHAVDDMIAALTSGQVGDALSKAQADLTRAIQRAALEGAYQVSLVQDRYGALTALAPPMATRLAEARRSAEAYSENVYGVAFDFVWPRLWLVIPEKDGASAIISDAQSQVDFSVMSVWLIGTVWITWGPIVLVVDGLRPWGLLLALVLGGPAVCLFFNELAVVSQWKLAEVTKATIDKYRISLLETLLQPPPASRAAERAAWQALRASEAAAGGGADVNYSYTPAA